MRNVPYALVVGSLMYVKFCMSSNIAFVVSVSSIYLSNLSEEHFIVVKTILKYLKRTEDLILSYE